MKFTNKQLIKLLLPAINRAIEELPAITFRQTDYYGHKYHEKHYHDLNVFVRYTDFEDRILIEVWIPLQGKYSNATLYTYYLKNENTLKRTSKGAVYGFSKEYAGLGNGYYADVMPDGTIIVSEYD